MDCVARKLASQVFSAFRVSGIRNQIFLLARGSSYAYLHRVRTCRIVLFIRSLCEAGVGAMLQVLDFSNIRVVRVGL